MAIYGDLSGRHIRFFFSHVPAVNEEGYSTNSIEMEILSGRIVTRPMQIGNYLPIGRIVGNTITHGIIVECELTAVLLMGNLPWDLGANSTNGGITTLTEKRLSVNTTIPRVLISVNRFGTSTNDAFYDEQFYAFNNPVVTSMEHQFETSMHQIFTISFQTDGYLAEPNRQEA